MDAAAPPSTTEPPSTGVRLERSFADALPELVVPWQADPAPAPHLLVFDAALAAELGLDPDALRTPAGTALLLGHSLPEGTEPVAMAYAGHQFGGFSPRLGDGRALLLGELVDPAGRRWDLHLKGSGRTPFARGGDGKAALGPMLREQLTSAAMHALGIPTTRALAVVATGEQVHREVPLPGAVLARVAASHLRVGTFQYAALHRDPDLLERLVRHAAARHHPAALEADNPARALLEHVVEAQAMLVAQWMSVGFVHGVMNTDNTTISGETIDYGPCAFMEGYDPETVFSSIDHGGRYAYGAQPGIAAWNLARLAETLLPLIDDDTDAAVESATVVVRGFEARFDQHHRRLLRAKLGLAHVEDPDDLVEADAVAGAFIALLHAAHADLTSSFRALAPAIRGDHGALVRRLGDPAAVDRWWPRYERLLPSDPAARGAVADATERTNPVYVPRNALVEEALDAATAGDLGPFEALLGVVSRPFDERPGLERYAEPAPAGGRPHRTFCGT